jgi:menaquinone-specific isochorismate synthase
MTLSWLEAHDRFPKFFWQERESGVSYAGVGDHRKGAIALKGWPSSGEPFAIYPDELLKGSALDGPKPLQIHVTHRDDLPDKSTWILLVNEALDAIRRGELEKVVLARTTTFTLEKPVSPYDLLQALAGGRGTLFLVQRDAQEAFLGMTPEHLYTLDERRIAVDALAGTVPLGAQFGSKERREFEWVKRGIVEALAPVTTAQSWAGEDQTVQAKGVQHLYNSYRGTLTGEADLVNLLHPTPAIGGWPRAAARDFTRKHEPFERDLYAMPLGLFFPDRACVAVTIRSVLLTGNKMQVFAGAGIVEGSDPNSEWNELEQKIDPITGLIA